MNQEKDTLVILDLETTGLGEMGERVVPVQIAAIALDPRTLEEKGRFERFLQIPQQSPMMRNGTTLEELRSRAQQEGWPDFASFVTFYEGAKLEEYAMGMHEKHEPKRDLEWFKANGEDPQTAWLEFVEFCAQYGRVIFGGHNAAKFDLKILLPELMRYGIALKKPKAGQPSLSPYIDLDHHAVDTAVYAYNHLVIKLGLPLKVSLKILAPALGIEFNEGKAHDAMYDVLKTIEVLKVMQTLNDDEMKVRVTQYLAEHPDAKLPS